MLVWFQLKFIKKHFPPILLLLLLGDCYKLCLSPTMNRTYLLAKLHLLRGEVNNL